MRGISTNVTLLPIEEDCIDADLMEKVIYQFTKKEKNVSYAKLYNTKKTPQSQPIPGSKQVKNSGGGFSFEVNDWTKLERFLTLGSDRPTFYASAEQLTLQNSQAVLNCIVEDATEVVRRIVDVSTNGKAVKNDPAIFALALVCANANQEGKRVAFSAVTDVCRTGTHILQFVECIKGLRGFGKGISKAISNWYTSKSPRDLAYQMVKYQQRGGWSHRDVFRLTHPKFDEDYNYIANWVTHGWSEPEKTPKDFAEPIWAFEKAKRATTVTEICSLIHDYKLVRECIPTQFLSDKKVWEALLVDMPMTGMIRNLGKMSAIGLVTDHSIATTQIVNKLTNASFVRKSRLHPLSVLNTLATYSKGVGVKGSLRWLPVQKIIDALDEAFYLAFDNVEPTNKRFYLGIDISGSMGWSMNGLSLSCRDASTALAMVTAAKEPTVYIKGFSHNLVNLPISPRRRLDDNVRAISDLPFGATNCSLPIIDAINNNIPVDVFCIYTDDETNYGGIHPCQALEQYRNRTGINAKLIVVGMVANDFSIANPDDNNSLDVVGFSTDTPLVISNFAKG